MNFRVAKLGFWRSLYFQTKKQKKREIKEKVMSSSKEFHARVGGVLKLSLGSIIHA
jgi:hypothetical protein